MILKKKVLQKSISNTEQLLTKKDLHSCKETVLMMLKKKVFTLLQKSISNTEK